jgi:hypothetical protein
MTYPLNKLINSIKTYGHLKTFEFAWALAMDNQIPILIFSEGEGTKMFPSPSHFPFDGKDGIP